MSRVPNVYRGVTVTVEELYQDYVVLRLQGFNEEEALADLLTYARPVLVSQLRDHLEELQASAG